jgi:hypothetical protein
MIKRWSKFNESNSVDNFKSEVEKIRSYFVEFEDDNLVTYEAKVIGKSEVDMMRSINPNSGAFDRWLSGLTEEANRYLNNEDYRKLFLRGSDEDFGKYPFCLCVNIKLKGEKDSEYYGSNCTISEEGVDMLEDVLVAYKRLKDDYDKITLDMNSSHSEYKPVTLKIYFNPIVD